MKTKVNLLEFRRGRSNAISLFVNGERVATAGGGGYDKKGAALGDWINKSLQPEMRAKKDEICNLYGARIKTVKDGIDRVSVDGATGESCMEEILKCLGYKMKRVFYSPKTEQIILTKEI